jgi:hypothetical protein
MEKLVRSTVGLWTIGYGTMETMETMNYGTIDYELWVMQHWHYLFLLKHLRHIII